MHLTWHNQAVLAVRHEVAVAVVHLVMATDPHLVRTPLERLAQATGGREGGGGGLRLYMEGGRGGGASGYIWRGSMLR